MTVSSVQPRDSDLLGKDWGQKLALLVSSSVMSLLLVQGSQGNNFLSRDIGQCMEAFSVLPAGTMEECYWLLEDRGQGYC